MAREPGELFAFAGIISLLFGSSVSSTTWSSIREVEVKASEPLTACVALPPDFLLWWTSSTAIPVRFEKSFQGSSRFLTSDAFQLLARPR